MKKLGFTEKIQNLIPSNISESELGRITAEHKERYILQSDKGIFNAEITGNLRFSAETRADFPAVGDWIQFMPMDEQSAVIIEIFPRYSVLERQAVGKHAEIQVIASNIDHAFIVQAVGHDFNLNRLERYLTICYSSGINPIVILNKVDLVPQSEIHGLVSQIKNRTENVNVIALSCETSDGLDKLKETMLPYETYCFMGSSGVGKSTIINCLLGNEVIITQEISSSTNKGQHTTSHRELFILSNGSIVIDTPGMRELGITDQKEGIETTFDQIIELAQQCRFGDCTHTNEKDCYVLKALESGNLDEDVYENYQKLKREQEHFSSTIFEKRQRDKEFGKMVKTFKDHKKKYKL
ncbi:MAG: ribosome small subunit-dependent GTPase A [Draconibacterium sp.]|nr:ribosome small subunit-dependent GTPase A [Draconibacterium sp.]